MLTGLVIFDLDGTLIDSSFDICSAINFAIEPLGLQPATVDETASLMGEGATRLIEKMIEKRGATLDPSLLLEPFLDYYSAHSTDHTCPFPGTKEVLEALSWCKKAIISNKSELLSLRVLEALELRKYFDFVAGGDTLPQKKPSPAPVLHVCNLLGVSPEEALLVGDSTYDMDAGKAAGVNTVAALYGYGSPGFSRKADYEIGSIMELLTLFERD
jgi:phosphoglycolate phosphatase